MKTNDSNEQPEAPTAVRSSDLLGKKYYFRVYENPEVRQYRWSATGGNDWPKDVEWFDIMDGKWHPCPNINIARRIAETKSCEATQSSHHWSRFTAGSIYCKNCGNLFFHPPPANGKLPRPYGLTK